MRPHLESRRLYIADLASRLHRMEVGQVALQPLAYRVIARRLRQALAGVAEPLVRTGFEELQTHLQPLVIETLETRHFENHGQLFGVWAIHSMLEATALLRRLRRPAKPDRGG